MQRIILSILLISFWSFSTLAQKKHNDMPNMDIKTLEGKMISARSIIKDKPTVISFWATWCKPCVKELSAIHDAMPDWKEVLDFKMIAISIDDSRSEHRVAPFVKSRSWEFEVYLDPNSELKRALNVATVPHTFVFDTNGKLVWQHSGYTEGDEEELLNKLMSLTNK